MKKLFFCFIFLFITNNALAIPKDNFTKALDGIQNIIKQYDTDEFYEDWEFKNKKTSEIKKFKDFDKLQRSVFFFTNGKAFNYKLEELSDAWKEELNKADIIPKGDEASKGDIEAYLAQLLLLRQQNAVKVEALLEHLFKKYPDKFTKSEKEFMLNEVQSYHDKNNLIKRGK